MTHNRKQKFVEIQRETLRDIAGGLKDEGTKPPIHVAWAVTSLVGDVVPDALSGHRTDGDDGTTWNAFAWVGDRVVTVTASAKVAGWGFDAPNGHTEPDSMTARARRVADITGIDVTEARGAGWDSRDIHNWTVTWRLQFADGDSFDLHHDSMYKSEGIVRMLLDKLM
ncbi:hypothetical protein [Nocardioides sp.]|uniref:hypothetical protein n=1 Tax=Nocardioides sp. TaxID=35761 RepID=UPI0019C9A347|nr:hypothetical protein [Nocardioides sp.]MBC7276704.1 hypothetical protein [Nocardioides sp.]